MLDDYDVRLWQEHPEQAPPEYFDPPINPVTGERSLVYRDDLQEPKASVHAAELLTRNAEARTDLPSPSMPEPNPGTRASESDTSLSPVRLTYRQAFILEAVGKLEGGGKRRNQAREIAKEADLDYDSRIRTDLSTLRKLGFLDNDGAGYFRTAKPYQTP
jgi:hypothetical protein